MMANPYAGQGLPGWMSEPKVTMENPSLTWQVISSLKSPVTPQKLTWNRKITLLERKIIFHPPPSLGSKSWFFGCVSDIVCLAKVAVLGKQTYKKTRKDQGMFVSTPL